MLSFGWTFVFTIINVLVLFFFLRLFLFKRVTNFLDKRSQGIRGDIERAEADRAQAEAARALAEEITREALAKAEAILRQASDDAKALAVEEAKKARQESAEIIARGRTQIESERAEAAEDLRQEAARLALALTARLLEREIRPEDQDGLLAHALATMGTEGR